MSSDNIEERKQRWRDFLSMDYGIRYVFQINYQPDDMPRPLPWPDKKSERIEWAWERYQRHLVRLIKTKLLNLWRNQEPRVGGCKAY
jgi:hypothetical protein